MRDLTTDCTDREQTELIRAVNLPPVFLLQATLLIMRLNKTLADRRLAEFRQASPLMLRRLSYLPPSPHNHRNPALRRSGLTSNWCRWMPS